MIFNLSTEKVQLAAVKQVGWAIRFINNPSEKVQLAVDLNNIEYNVAIHSKDKIIIGCQTLSLKEWMEYKSDLPILSEKKLKEQLYNEVLK